MAERGNMTHRFSSVPMPEDEPKVPKGDSAGSSTGMAGIGRASLEQWAEDAYHGQRGPGAYEWWYFEAMDAAGNGVVLYLFEGLVFHPFYVSACARWHRR